jgi:hypothetical protein
MLLDHDRCQLRGGRGGISELGKKHASWAPISSGRLGALPG